jgi:hypothetical protein
LFRDLQSHAGLRYVGHENPVAKTHRYKWRRSKLSWILQLFRRDELAVQGGYSASYWMAPMAVAGLTEPCKE